MRAFVAVGIVALVLAVGCGPTGQAVMADDARPAGENERPLGKEVRTLTFPDIVLTTAWSHNGRYIAASNDVGNRVYLYDLEHDEIRWMARKGGLVHEGIAFSPDDKWVIAGPMDDVGEEKTWEMTIGLIATETGKARNLGETRPGKDINYAAKIALSSDGKALIALVGKEGRILVYDTTTWQVTHRLGPVVNETRKAVMDGFVALDTGRDMAVFGDTRGAVETWRLSTNTKLAEFQAYKLGAVMVSMILDPVTGILVTGEKGDDRTGVRGWDPLTGKRMATYPRDRGEAPTSWPLVQTAVLSWRQTGAG